MAGTFIDDLERAGGVFESVWMVDHLQADDAGVLECFTTLTYLVARHPRFQAGHAVVCQSFRNPALLAKMATAFEFLSGGRYTLGLGAGWNEEEYRAYGYDFPLGGVRVEQLAETLQIVTALWTEAEVFRTGGHYRVVNARCEPRPEPVPAIMLGAFGPKTLRFAARYADEWIVSSTGVEGYGRTAAEFEGACIEVGRNPATVRRSWIGGVACARHDADVVAAGRVSGDDAEVVVGTPDQIVDQMRAFVALGVDHFMHDCADFLRLQALDLLVDEALPAFR